jgi:putative resolvase
MHPLDEQGKVRVVRAGRLRGEAPPATQQRVLAIYGRVSSHEQKTQGDLERQVALIRAVMEQGSEPPFAEVVAITDVASGLSDRRAGLLRLMSLARQGRITDLAITYKDRLTRFGFGYLERFFTGCG